jgi:hypothetical protein
MILLFVLNLKPQQEFFAKPPDDPSDDSVTDDHGNYVSEHEISCCRITVDSFARLLGSSSCQFYPPLSERFPLVGLLCR